MPFSAIKKVCLVDSPLAPPPTLRRCHGKAAVSSPALSSSPFLVGLPNETDKSLHLLGICEQLRQQLVSFVLCIKCHRLGCSSAWSVGRVQSLPSLRKLWSDKCTCRIRVATQGTRFLQAFIHGKLATPPLLRVPMPSPWLSHGSIRARTMPDARCQMPDARCQMLDASCQMPDMT